jgi:hypothetical protein
MVQWLITGIVSLMHPFFVSVIEINHNTKEATVEISVRIFTEDLEKTLQQNNKGKVDMLNPPDKALLDKQIGDYLTQKLKLRIDGKPVAMHYLGHEIQKESVWSYLEIPNIKSMKQLGISCTLLYDFEKMQSNIFHVKNMGEDKSYKLDYPQDQTTFNF